MQCLSCGPDCGRWFLLFAPSFAEKNAQNPTPNLLVPNACIKGYTDIYAAKKQKGFI